MNKHKNGQGLSETPPGADEPFEGSTDNSRAELIEPARGMFGGKALGILAEW